MEDAKRAMEIAQKKLSGNDYDGAKNFINKAERLYPNLDGLKQVSMMIDVYKSASNRGGGEEEESDWYGILGVDPLADEEAVKKTYKQLALLLHPDKNKFDGAEGAFKLVLEAWCLLSDKAKRASYDQRRKTKMQKPTNQQQDGVDTRKEARSSNEYASEQRQTSDFWTSSIWTNCSRCKKEWLYFNLTTDLNKAKVCSNCGHQTYIAIEQTPKALNKRRTSIASQQQQQWSGVQSKATEKRTSKASEQKQEWITVQNKAPDKSTEKASSFNFTLKCSSVSMKASSNCGIVANQKSKRRLEEFAAEKIPKKARI